MRPAASHGANEPPLREAGAGWARDVSQAEELPEGGNGTPQDDEDHGSYEGRKEQVASHDDRAVDYMYKGKKPGEQMSNCKEAS